MQYQAANRTALSDLAFALSCMEMPIQEVFMGIHVEEVG